jgi:hypothetical protein
MAHTLGLLLLCPKEAADPRELFAQASQELQITARFKSLLEQFLPQKRNLPLAV